MPLQKSTITQTAMGRSRAIVTMTRPGMLSQRPAPLQEVEEGDHQHDRRHDPLGDEEELDVAVLDEAQPEPVAGQRVGGQRPQGHLGISRATMYRKMRRYGIVPSSLG
ncbi:hypothetical protein ACH5A2_38835 [Streptomyces collinus]|uniref:hypothetical protein n=1 Tax=Streptomyces collinus TaxID=42684 RepID=UPI0037B641C0